MKYLPFLLILLAGCATTRTAETSISKGLAALREAMTGTFDSSAQAAADSSYYDISLRMFPIWQDRAGTWLYVEQAVSDTPDRPYRQRVYELRELGDDRFASVVYSLNNQDDAVGKWASPDWFDQFSTDMLEERAGCTVFLTQLGRGRYAGSTEANNCQSSLRGASYATSEVVISKDKIGSWDRGWNEAEEQVWGATEGGYIFERR